MGHKTSPNLGGGPCSKIQTGGRAPAVCNGTYRSLTAQQIGYLMSPLNSQSGRFLPAIAVFRTFSGFRLQPNPGCFTIGKFQPKLLLLRLAKKRISALIFGGKGIFRKSTEQEMPTGTLAEMVLELQVRLRALNLGEGETPPATLQLPSYPLECKLQLTR